MNPTGRVVLILGILCFGFAVELNGQTCTLNAAWMGDWVDADLEDGAQRTTITTNTFSGKGVCIDQDKNKEKHIFTYKHEKETCYKCLIIFQPHRNILQYKQSEHCEESSALDICDEIHSYAPLHSLFRHDAVPVSCPFKQTQQYTFTYSRHGLSPCTDPLSTAQTCIEPTKMIFNYNACPDKLETSHTHIEIECIATWKDGSHNYMVAKEKTVHSVRHDLESYRCYFYESRLDSGKIVGYNVYRSEDRGTCAHVSSPTDSPNSIVLTEAKPEKACKFPSWITSREWVILNRTISVLGSEENTVLSVVQNPRNSTSEEHRLVCDDVEHDSGSRATLRVNQTLGCKVLTICMDVHQLTTNVLELVLHRSRSLHRGESCNDSMSENLISLVPKRKLIYTLIDSNANAVNCPFHEKYTVSDLAQAINGKIVQDKSEGKESDGFKKLEIGVVSNNTNIRFYSSKVKVQSTMYCVAFWKDGDHQYLIAGNAHFHIPGYRCFEFIEDRLGFNVSMRMDDCKSSTESQLDQQTYRLHKGLETEDAEAEQHVASSAASPSPSYSKMTPISAIQLMFVVLQLILLITCN